MCPNNASTVTGLKPATGSIACLTQSVTLVIVLWVMAVFMSRYGRIYPLCPQLWSNLLVSNDYIRYFCKYTLY